MTAKKKEQKNTVQRIAEHEILEVTDAVKKLRFFITKEHVEGATCGDPMKCVIAQALTEAIPSVDAVEVGSSITKIVDRGKVIRYHTPARLRAALREFDLTGGWNLPEGTYILLPPSGRNKLRQNQTKEEINKQNSHWDKWQQNFERRKEEAKKFVDGEGMNVFKGRPLLTRRISLTKSIPLNS